MFRISYESLVKKAKLDVKDKKILVLLSENSRMPISEIAKKVQLSRDTVNYRIKRMQKLGIILKFFPEIDFKKLGYSLYHVFLLVDEKDKQRQKELIDALINHPNTLSVMEYSDRWDLEWNLLAKEITEFDSIVTEIFAQFSDIIMERSKLLVINTYYSILLPYHFYKEFGTKKIPDKIEQIDYRLNKNDLEIMRVLGNNSRLSTYEISKQVNLSADAIGLRIKKLIKSGIIKKLNILPNFSLLGCSWYTFALRMKTLDKADELKFKTFVEDHPNIIKAVKTLGRWDLLVYITADNPKEFHKTIKQIKNEFSKIIVNYATYVAYKEHVFNSLPKAIQ